MHQLDNRYQPCNFVEIMPRLDEHLRRPKAEGRDGVARSFRSGGFTKQSQCSLTTGLPQLRCRSVRVSFKPGFLVNVPRGSKHAVSPQRDFLVAGASREADTLVDQPRA